MENDDVVAMTEAGEEFGSVAWAFEKSWLAGMTLGFLAIVLLGRRRARCRARHQRSE